ncbi:MAG: helix-turn-helix transcriptional regulator [Gammaproteobacteria bacterium]|nr:helix-turn-helix transcriptional regulator [Gammaproteobacteria bacterium]
MDEVYRAIADPTRRAILDELVDRDGQTLFELCTRLTMKHGIASSRQAVSQHVEMLESARLVISERNGRFKFHWFNGAPLRAIAERWPTKRAAKGSNTCESTSRTSLSTTRRRRSSSTRKRSGS